MSREPDDCDRAYAELETQRTETFAELADWSPLRVNFRPTPDSWSAIQVLDHVVRAETGTIKDIRLGLRNPHLLGTEDRPGIAALKSALRSDRSFQVPPGAVAIYPDAQITLPEVAKCWEKARLELGRLLREFGPHDSSRGVFCHPFAGWMTLAEVLSHFSDHLYHHGFQLARLRASSTDLT